MSDLEANKLKEGTHTEPLNDFGRKAAATAGGAASVASQTLLDGYSAIRDVHRASKEHNAARNNLAKLNQHIDEQKAELAHRQEVEQTYDELVPSLEARIRSITERLTEIDAHIITLQEEHEDLSSRLKEMKEQHEHELHPYRDLMDSAKSRTEDTQKLLAEIRRSSKNAESQLKNLTERRDASVSALNRSAENARTRINELKANLRATKNDSSAKPGTADELEAAIATETEHLRITQEKIDAITQEMKRSIDSAQMHLWTQRQSAEEAERAHETAKAEAQIRREDYEKMRQDAESEEAVLDNAIVERNTDLRDARKQREDTQTELDETKAELAEAHDIHATPEATVQLRDAIAKSETEFKDKQREVESLATAERRLRERTRLQRRIFIGVVVAAVLIVALVVWLIAF